MTHIEQRIDTAAAWTAVNPILRNGEVGWEKVTLKGKIGDGVTAWNALPYFVGAVASVAGKTGAVTLVNADVAGSAPLASPALTGFPTAPTRNAADNSTNLATTAFVKTQIATGAYAPINSPAFTGNPTAVTQLSGDNSTRLATTAFVKAQGYATLVSPSFSGAPLVPTQATTDNSTRIASTAYVKANLGAFASWIPTITAETGTITTVNVTGARFIEKANKEVYFTLTINIVAAGTGANQLRFTLPVPAASGSRMGEARENASTGWMGQVIINAGSIGGINKWDNSSLIGSGYSVIASGTYERS